MKLQGKKHQLKKWFMMKAALGAAIFAGEGGSGLVWGEEAAAPATPEPVAAPATTTLPEVVVTGDQQKPASPKYTEPLRNIPQTLTIIPKQMMEQQNATSLRDVLRNVPGISMSAGEGGVPAGDNMSIRGFSARTDIFIDNVRDFGGYSRDPFNFEQVEVAKGPASSISGRGTTGGAINMVSKSPALDAFYNGTVGFGNEEYKRATIDFNRPIKLDNVEGAALRLNALWHENTTPRRDNVDNRRWGVAPSVALGLGTPTRMILSYFHLSQDNTPDYGIPFVPNTNNALLAYRDMPAPVKISNWYGLKSRDYELVKTDIMTAQIHKDMTENITLRYALRYGRTLRDSIITAPRFAGNNTTNIFRQPQSRDMLDTIASNQIDVVSNLEAWKTRHTLVTGIEFARETSMNRARQVPAGSVADLYRPESFTNYIATVSLTGARTEAKADTLALYMFDTVKLGEMLELTGGFRWDSFKVNYESVSTTGAITPLNSVDKLLSWKVGAVFKPMQIGSIYAAYGTSFNPSAEGLTLTNATNALAPEKTSTVEVGTKWDLLRQGLSASLAVFRTEKTDARTPGVNAGEPPTILEGEQRVDGIEVGAAGSILPDLTLYLGYTHLKSEIVKSNTAGETGKEITQTPRNSFSLWSTYLTPWKLEVGAGAQFVGKRYANNSNTRQVDGYWLVDATASYPVSKNIDLRVNGSNLTDQQYFDRLGGGHLIPGQGMSVSTTLAFKY